MANEAGGCNGDLKVEEEVGGSFVIINGGPGESSEEDLDLDLEKKRLDLEKKEEIADVAAAESGIEVGSGDPGDSEVVPAGDHEADIVVVESVGPAKPKSDAVADTVEGTDDLVKPNDKVEAVVKEKEPEVGIAEEVKEPESVTEETSIVEIEESSQTPDTSIVDNKNVEGEEVKELASVAEESNNSVLESTVQAESEVEKEEMKEAESVSEEPGSEDVEASLEAVVESNQQQEDPVVKDDSVEVEEQKEQSTVLEDDMDERNRNVELESANVEPDETKDKESVIEDTGKTDVDANVEPVVELSQQPKDPVVENEIVEIEEQEQTSAEEARDEQARDERVSDVELESATETELNVEAEETKDKQSVIEENGTANFEANVEAVVELSQQPEDLVVEDDSVEVEEQKEQCSVPKEAMDDRTSDVELESATETELKVESDEKKDKESVIEETGTANVEANVEAVVELSQQFEDPFVDADERTSDVELEPVTETEMKVEADETKDVIEETGTANVEANAEAVEDNSVQPEQKKQYSVLEEATDERSKDVELELATESELKAEAEERKDEESVIEEANGIAAKPEHELLVSEDDKVEVEEKKELEYSDEALDVIDKSDVEPVGLTADQVSVSEAEKVVVEDKNEPEASDEALDVAETLGVEPVAVRAAQVVPTVSEANYVSDNVVATENVIDCSESTGEEVDRFINGKNLVFGLFNHNENTAAQPDEPISCPDPSEMEAEVSVELVAGGLRAEPDILSESNEGGEYKVDVPIETPCANIDGEEESSKEKIQASPEETHVVKRHAVYLAKVPKFTDDELEKQIQQAIAILNEKTDIRESIQEDIRKQLVILLEREEELRDASGKEDTERALLNTKVEEIESVQLVINRIGTATSIVEMDEKIKDMTYRQQHETITLQQEKAFIREINHLKRLREQLFVNNPSQEKINDVLAQKADAYARLEVLRNELKQAKELVKSAYKIRNEVRQRVLGEKNKFISLKDQYRVANVDRQEAYNNLQGLRKQLYDKLKHFRIYREDMNAAGNYKYSGDNEGLRSHCSRQVERFMSLWNEDEEFRKEYVKANSNSTLKRLGTLDGRSLGPGEEAPIISSHIDKKSNGPAQSSSDIETSGGKPEKNEALATKQVTRTNQFPKLQSSTKAITKEVMPMEPQKKDENDAKIEELAREEEELRKEKAAKEEELRKENAAKEEEAKKEKAKAELERVRAEQKAKAKEAEERKRRKADKARAKADLRTQKEAELKQKKKEKKEMKKAYGEEPRNEDLMGEASSIADSNLSETSPAGTSNAKTSKRRASRSVVPSKQYDRVQPLPLPLRNRGKRKMTTWIWAISAIMLVIALFFAGNYMAISRYGAGFKF